MPGLTPEDRSALSEDENALLDQFEEKPDAGTDEGAGEAPPEGAASDEHGGAPADDGEPEPTDQGSGDEGHQGEGEPAPVADVIRIGTREVSREDVEALLEFQDWTREHREQMQAFGAYLNGEAEFVVRGQKPPAEEAPKPDEGIDWDLVDPAVKQLYEAQTAQMQEMGQRLESLQNPIQQWQQQQAEEASRQAADQIAQGTEAALGKLGLELSPDEVDRLQLQTANMGILVNMRQQIADPIQAVSAALEAAVWATPEWRDRLVERQVASAEAQAKKELAGRVGGTSGSDRSGVSSSAAPVPASMSKEDRQAAMATEIAQYMRGE